jgi:D-xylose transport system ATP-binding protein
VGSEWAEGEAVVDSAACAPPQMSGSAVDGPAITSGDGSSRDPLLRAEGIAKRFGNVRALAGVSLSIYPGEIVALVGDNGAGKSCFVSILSGVRRPDSGHLYIDGEPVTLSTPAVAHRYGIVTVFQDLALVNERDVAANIFLGRELTRFGGLVVDRAQMLRDAQAIIRRLQVGLPDVRTPVKSLSGGQRQAVAVARAIVRGKARMVIMDEPTAALGVRESGKVNDLIRALKGEGRTVLLISHNVEHVFNLADRVAVFRLGHCIADLKISDTTHDEVVGLIVRGKQQMIS